ncbi:MAG: hypothetical protein J7M15_03975 [Anaerolineae bacterium]|nr:hypothetical protein [Anaerolineae bacterium]
MFSIRHSILAIERVLELAARRYIDENRTNTGLERAMRHMVRAAFDLSPV